VPIRYVGVGETAEDLLPFDASSFANSLFGTESAGEAGGPR
jgi:signal recognition particle GTPase